MGYVFSAYDQLRLTQEIHFWKYVGSNSCGCVYQSFKVLSLETKKLSGNKIYSSYSIIWRMGSREQLNGSPWFLGWRGARPQVVPKITTRASWFINNVSTPSASQSIPYPPARTISVKWCCIVQDTTFLKNLSVNCLSFISHYSSTWL